MKPNNLTIIIIVSVLVIIAGVIVYFTVFNKTAPKPKPKTDCFENDINYAGYDIDSPFTQKATAEECQAFCQEDSSCKFWTFNPSSRDCYRKTSKAGRIAVTDGDISGPRVCP